eukprot:1157661-Pelagomonas_calceolata.AAC.2
MAATFMHVPHERSGCNTHSLLLWVHVSCFWQQENHLCIATSQTSTQCNDHKHAYSGQACCGHKSKLASNVAVTSQN